MKMKSILFACFLIVAIPQSVHALSPQPLQEAEPAGAAQLQSAPELMECSVERSQALWQFPNPVRLGEVPCQYLGSLGGPDNGESVVYSPDQLDGTASAIEIDRSQSFEDKIIQPLDSFAPGQPTRGQLIDLSSESLKRFRIFP